MKRQTATSIRKKVDDLLEGIDFEKYVFTKKRRLGLFLLWIWPPARKRKKQFYKDEQHRLETEYKKQFYKDAKREYKRLRRNA